VWVCVFRSSFSHILTHSLQILKGHSLFCQKMKSHVQPSCVICSTIYFIILIFLITRTSEPNDSQFQSMEEMSLHQQNSDQTIHHLATFYILMKALILLPTPRVWWPNLTASMPRQHMSITIAPWTPIQVYMYFWLHWQQKNFQSNCRFAQIVYFSIKLIGDAQIECNIKYCDTLSKTICQR
jgi:hypothetical protein